MQRFSNQTLFVFFTALTLLLIYLLTPILTPFLLGALIAYLADPLVRRLEKWGLPHLLSVILVFMLLICIFLSFILILTPLIQNQISTLIEETPNILSWMQETMIPWLKTKINIATLKTTLSSALPKADSIFNTLLQSSFTIIDWLINLVLTPIVTFYLLRDWDSLCHGIANLLPKSNKKVIVDLAHECDQVLSAFFRGQLLVMIALCFIYGIGLTLIGLQVGPIIGVLGGLLSIVPFLGSVFVVVASSITALVQFHTWQPLLWVFAVYLVGQITESYVLTPHFVGSRIGLHPVAVIFSVMAGGALFGFFGILVALPAAALIKVLLRFIHQRYRLAYKTN